MAERFEPTGTIALDIEIAKTTDSVGGWDFTGEMGVACTVVYEFQRQRFRVYDHNELEELHACLDRCDRIITWGGWRFDFPVIYGANKADWPNSPFRERLGGSDKATPFSKRSFDMLRVVYASMRLNPDDFTPAHHGWSLGDVGEAVLGISKSADGADAPLMFQQGRWGELITYCQQDVWLTKELYLFMKKHRVLFNKKNKLVRIEQ